MFFKTAPARHLKSYVRAPSYLLPYRRISQNTPHSVRPVVAIKRETVNLWEQRSPLVPNQVKQLVQNGVRVLVQPSNRRCFSATEFEAAGAIMQEDIHEASLILGVKRPTELRSTDLLPEKTYAFFTHTIKAQPDNMEMLDTLLERKIRIIDYECMVNNANQRVVAFGKYAGFAGTIDILHGLGIRLLAMGHTTPFLQISMAHNYTNLQQAQQSLRLAGYEIARGRLPDSIGPLIFVVHGDGNVSQGSQLILDSLPVQYIRPEQLNEVARSGNKNYIYVCVANVSHYMQHVDGKPFVLSEYFKEPQNYKSTFIEKIAPYMSVLINGTYWDARIDRILTKENVKSLMNIRPGISGQPTDEACPTLPHRLLAICDISADPGGSVEFTDECTTMDEPFLIYNPKTEQNTKGIIGDGILMCSIDNMPAQLPFEASEHFGNVLMPYLEDMIKSDATKPFADYNARPEVKNVSLQI
ncbi:Alpha-aminoadipic semialdehyde synthase [Paragonimus heterotremus]|uniref:Alpha-aminoadipic semialdehyde synthase n=1 Tax=Paragonimus heterotremus TaxID=100268 RepID=A0A8J4SY26_9TREM|nr:Alpha-aminoadipic semialdehyde synthase [Paragonimus heterotremus]